MRIQDIKEIIDDWCGFDIATKTHKRKYAEARMIANYCFFRYADQYVTYQIIADYWQKNHATVISSVRKFYDVYETEKDFKKRVDKIVSIIEQKRKEEIENNIKIDVDVDVKNYDYLQLRHNYFRLQQMHEKLYENYRNARLMIKRLKDKV